ncbi:hypothetical protein [Peptacetobacter hiranonis]|nr:hypothetical protein [Peptacetobacter hiranonis]
MINYEIVFVVLLFMVLVSIQFTLNKIYVELKDIKRMMKNKELEEITENEKKFDSFRF